MSIFFLLLHCLFLRMKILRDNNDINYSVIEQEIVQRRLCTKYVHPSSFQDPTQFCMQIIFL